MKKLLIIPLIIMLLGSFPTAAHAEVVNVRTPNIITERINRCSYVSLSENVDTKVSGSTGAGCTFTVDVRAVGEWVHTGGYFDSPPYAWGSDRFFSTQSPQSSVSDFSNTCSVPVYSLDSSLMPSVFQLVNSSDLSSSDPLVAPGKRYSFKVKDTAIAGETYNLDLSYSTSCTMRWKEGSNSGDAEYVEDGTSSCVDLNTININPRTASSKYKISISQDSCTPGTPDNPTSAPVTPTSGSLPTQPANNAMFVVSPTTATLGVNQETNLSININTGGVQTSGADLILTFDPVKVAVLDITGGTVYDQFVGKAIDNAAGRVTLSGIASSPASLFTGAGVFATVRVQGVGAGTTPIGILFTPGNQNDSNIVNYATQQDILARVTDGTITVEGGIGGQPPTPTSASTPIPTPTTPAVTGASLSLSPAANSSAVDAEFTVAVNLDTAGAQTAGTDFVFTFDPARLTLVDITQGSLYDVYVGKTIDNTAGKGGISGLASSTTSSFSGTGTFATLRFRGIQNGTVPVTISFAPGNPNDSNIADASTQADVLTHVVNGSYTIGQAGLSMLACNACGYCGGGKVPDDYVECVQCLYNNPGDVINPFNQQPSDPKSNVQWTVLGCAQTDVGQYVNQLFTLATGTIGGLSLLATLYGGYLVMTSAGNAVMVSRGKNMIKNGLIAGVIVLLSAVIQQTAGLNILQLPGF